MSIPCITEIKTEILWELLYKYVEELSKKYDDYLNVGDCQGFDSDCEIRIYLDSIYKIDEFNDKNMYGVYLKDYELKCKEFIMELDEKLPLNHLIFDEIFYDEDDLDGEFYYSCALCFKIKKSEVYYY